MNINTSTPVVNASLDKALNGLGLLQTPFKDIGEFIKQLQPLHINSEGLATNSSYFLLKSKIRLADYSLAVESLIYRENHQNTRIIKRAISHE